MKPATLSADQKGEVVRATIEELQAKYKGKLERADMAAEIWAARQQNQELKRQVAVLCAMKEDDRLHIQQLTTRINKAKSISLDQITLMGQVDVAIWGVRELGLERFLNPEFKRILQNQGTWSFKSRLWFVLSL